ncbi:f-box only protein [Anaeramoeba ignava]|uniref:F-box only protein n=1 Tax=Anaeramoeba ignava TaxID=1746090 RepID=A0A9Q0LFV1_ANAIG|nr:f-box only protein [Anaeramoeba ignava]
MELKYHSYEIYEDQGVAIFHPEDNFWDDIFGISNETETSIKPSDKEPFLEDLPPEILWIIFQYLSPRQVILVGLTNKNLNEIIQHPSLWKDIAINFEELFIWKDLNVDHLSILGKQISYEEFKEEVEHEDEKNINNEINNENQENINNDNDINIVKVDNNRKNDIQKFPQEIIHLNPQINQAKFIGNTFYIVDSQAFPFILSTKQQRIDYISRLENPFEELKKKVEIAKSKTIEVQKEIKRRRNRKSKDYYEHDYLVRLRMEAFRSVFSILLYLAIAYLFVVINIYVDKKMEMKLTTLLIPSFVMCFCYIIIILVSFKFGAQVSTGIMIILMILVINLEVLFISMKIDRLWNVSWLIVFLFIYIILLIAGFMITTIVYQIIDEDDFRNDREKYAHYTFLIFPLCWLLLVCAFFILLGLKLDDKLNDSFSYWKLFSLLFTTDLMPPLFGFCVSIVSGELKDLGVFTTVFLFSIFIFGYFEIMLVCYITGVISTSFAVVLIPFYLILFICFFVCILILIDNIKRFKQLF